LITASVVALLLVLMLLGIPLAFALGIAGMVGLLLVGGPVLMVGILDATIRSAAGGYELVTVPMFMLMAEFVVVSGVADKLFDSARIWVGRLPAGLGIATAWAGAGFGAISGSSTAAAATLASTTIPAMLKQGYEPKMACGVVSVSGTLAMLIPPSIAIVLYGLIADQSIGELLIAGIVPGLLVTVTITITVLVLVWIDPKVAPRGQRYNLAEKFRSLEVVGPMVVLVMLVTGVIYLGVATPTEAAGLGAFGALAISIWMKKMTWRTLRAASIRAAQNSCMILMILLGARIFAYFFTLTQVTQDIVAFMADANLNRWLVISLILVMYLVMGCFLDQISMMVLTVPLLLPVIKFLGFDPIWFGMLVILAAEVGMITPPVGFNVFVVSRYTGRPLDEVFLGAFPHVVAHVILVAILTAFPGIILWLPSTMAH
jgi:tripartite ATP-independent transporter DctM subunit